MNKQAECNIDPNRLNSAVFEGRRIGCSELQDKGVGYHTTITGHDRVPQGGIGRICPACQIGAAVHIHLQVESIAIFFIVEAFYNLDMIDHLIYQISQETEGTAGLYYKLILLVADPETKYLIDYDRLANRTKSKPINVNLELSQSMLALTSRQRALKVASLLGTIITAAPHDTVLLTHIHILFDPVLRQDPLRLLQNLSRHKTIIAVWEGQIQGRYLTYAKPGHAEYRRYPTRELIVISLASNA